MSRKYYGESKYNSCKFWSSSFAATVFLLVISGITFIVCGAVIAGPGIRALNFEETTCSALIQEYLQPRSCKCEGYQNKPDCSSRFPCIRITVEYYGPINNNSADGRIVANLHEHESTKSSEFSECSVFSCKEARKANDYKVKSFSQKYGNRGKNFTCYYDKNNPTVAITKRNYSRVDIIIALALPGAMFIILSITLTVMCIAKRRPKKKKPEPKPRASRGYMNPTIVMDNHEPMFTSEIPLPSCCTSLTYVRLEDPLPPRKIAFRTL